MSMGNSSTSMGDALSNTNNQVSGSFDLNSWQGLSLLLKKANESGLTDEQKARFRDAVLTYAQSGGDPEIKAKITKIATALTDAAPDALTVSEKAKDGVVKSAKPFVSAKKEAPVDLPVQKITTAAPQTTKEDEVADAVLQEAMTKDTAPKAVTATPSKVVPTPELATPSEASTNVTSKSVAEHKERIAEIKRLVSEEVGNPIMLIDSGNPLGREYMTALLKAMKSTAGTKAGVLGHAMQDLEDAYKKLTEYIEKKGPIVQNVHKKDTAPPKPEEVAVQHVEKKEETLLTPGVSPIEAEPVSLPKTPPIQSAPPKKVASTPQRVATIPAPKERVSVPVPSASISDSDGTTQVVADVAPEKKQAYVKKLTENLAPPPVPPAPKLEDIAPSPVPQKKTDAPAESVQEVAKEAVKISEVPEPPVIGQVDLMTPEITMSLTQLLDEWILFKGSGMFGMGPDGIEHPLYVQLKDLPMSTVMAGRWEKSGKNDIRILKDYVHAWRNEQGIAYNQTESFEHYLRRVVKKILKRRNR